MLTQSIYKGWKLTKIDATIICKPHAHPHFMKKTYTKFQKCKRSCPHNKHHCLYIQGEKWLSLQCLKSDKKWSNNYVQSTCTSSYHEKNICKVSKQLVQNCKRSCAHNKHHCLYIQGEKWLSWQCQKSDKNWSNNYVQSTCTSSYHEENTCKVSKQLVQNCKRTGFVQK